MMDTIDLRSDTVTWPTDEMRQAIARAPVGDDIYGEDPTVNRLQAEAAEMLGKEAALLVSSGNQGNLIAVLTHCPRGTEVILGDKAHIFRYEAGGISAFGGVHPHTIPLEADGTMPLDAIRQAIREDDEHFPRTRLICLENTQGTMGGIPLTKAYTDDVAAIARENGLALHIDGARIFNAATALGISAADLIEQADSMTFCLSKGLCAPVGSILVGDKAFIKEAHRIRKALGGGMRQAGIIAAAGLISLRKMTKRLHKDHERARFIADSLRDVDDLHIKSVHTNFVFFELSPSAKLTPAELIHEAEAQYNVKLSLYPGYTHTFRIVTHYWITQSCAQIAAEVIRELLS
ncbi:MAG: low-specificity L-threonine aldolase [Anaerolineaceae bacterium]|nr:MAG: low-specificity L-threonine aldolase [Anaerolineaceae bacterium]